jgi:hypothetical protein
MDTNLVILISTILIIIMSASLLNYNFYSGRGEGGVSENFIGFFNRNNNNNKDFIPNINPPWILNSELNNEVYKITTTILNKINNDLKTNYQLGKLDNVVNDFDLEGNKRYIIDFFVHQLNHQNVNDLKKKIIVDVSLLKGTNNLQINTLNFSNAQKFQDPSLNLNTETTTQLALELNENNNLILKSSLTGEPYKPYMTDDALINTSLEYNPNKTKTNKTQLDLTDTNRRPWILPLNIQDKASIRAFPCQDYGNWWDENGIPLTVEQENGLIPSKKPKWCYNSYNSATEPRYIVAQRYPQFKKQPSDRHYNDWLFDRKFGTNNMLRN